MTELEDVNEDSKLNGNAQSNNTVQYAGVRISLENCIFPEKVFEESPSQKDGLSRDVEDDLRYYGCHFIQAAGILLKVQQVAMATAQVLFQRFYYTKSFVKFKMLDTAMACIWLASKVEECPRRVRDVINVFHCLEQKRKKEANSPMALDLEYVTTKNNVIKAERRLLKELGFCVHVKHPHKIIVIYLQLLDMEKNTQLVQTAWNYMNDSLRTSVFVRYPPETIACACIYLAARVLQIPLPTNPSWFDLFNADETDLHDICISILKVYQAKPTTYELTEAKVQDIRDAIQKERQKARGLDSDKLASANNSPMSTASGGSPYQRDTKNLAKKAVLLNKSRHDSRDIGAQNDTGKRSRTRSSSNRGNNQSPTSSDSEADRSNKKRRRNDNLPKSYSQHNDDSRERRRRRHKHRKTHRSGSHHRSRKSRHGSRERNFPTETSHKKHKRKSEKAPNGSTKQNGEKERSPKSRRKHSSRHRHENYKKQRANHSPISPPLKA